MKTLLADQISTCVLCPFNFPVFAAVSSRWHYFMRTFIIGTCMSLCVRVYPRRWCNV